MGSTGDHARVAGWVRISLLACMLIGLTAPLTPQTDSTGTGMSTREKLLRLLGDSTARAPRSTAPPVKPAPVQRPVEREEERVDRSVSPVTGRGDVAAAPVQSSPVVPAPEIGRAHV